MSGLPEKPEAVAHVTDAHWKAALVEAVARSDRNVENPETRLSRLARTGKDGAADYARCLILLGEVPEPIDPIKLAIRKSWREYRALSIGRDDSTARDWRGGRMDDQVFCSASLANFEAACRKYLPLPEADSL